MAGIVKQNLYSVKIATYKDSHGWKTERKQSESPGSGKDPQRSKACRETANLPQAGARGPRTIPRTITARCMMRY